MGIGRVVIFVDWIRHGDVKKSVKSCPMKDNTGGSSNVPRKKGQKETKSLRGGGELALKPKGEKIVERK